MRGEIGILEMLNDSGTRGYEDHLPLLRLRQYSVDWIEYLLSSLIAASYTLMDSVMLAHIIPDTRS